MALLAGWERASVPDGRDPENDERDHESSAILKLLLWFRDNL